MGRNLNYSKLPHQAPVNPDLRVVVFDGDAPTMPALGDLGKQPAG